MKKNQTNNIIKKYEISLKKLDFKGIFKPTKTSLELIKVANTYLKKKQDILDLGCGGGIVAYNLYRKNLSQKFFLSDIDKKSVKKAERNLNQKNIKCNFKIGDCFAPWNNHHFDLIINDVSGVSKQIATLSPWFKNVPTDDSKKGIGLLKKVIQEARIYMKKNSYIIFPIISLSDVNQAKKIVAKNLKIMNIKKVSWPLPKEMYKYKKFLSKEKIKQNIDYEIKYNMIICYTLIVSAKKK